MIVLPWTNAECISNAYHVLGFFAGAVMKHPLSSTDMTRSDVQKEMMNWLRGASDRDGGRKRRQQARDRVDTM